MPLDPPVMNAARMRPGSRQLLAMRGNRGSIREGPMARLNEDSRSTTRSISSNEWSAVRKNRMRGAFRGTPICTTSGAETPSARSAFDVK